MEEECLSCESDIRADYQSLKKLLGPRLTPPLPDALRPRLQHPSASAQSDSQLKSMMLKFLRSQPKLRGESFSEVPTMFCHLCLKDMGFPLEPRPTFWSAEAYDIVACGRCVSLLRVNLTLDFGVPGDDLDVNSPLLQLLAYAVLTDQRMLGMVKSAMNIKTEDNGSHFNDMLSTKDFEARPEEGSPQVKPKKPRKKKSALGGISFGWGAGGVKYKNGRVCLPLNTAGMETLLTHMSGKQVSSLVDSMQADKLFPKDLGQTSSRIWEKEEEGYGPRNVFKLKQEDQCIGYDILVKLVKTLTAFMPEAQDMPEAMDLIRMFFRLNQDARNEVVRLRGSKHLLVPCISVHASAEVICDFHNLQVHDPRVMAYCALPGIGAAVGKLAVLVDSHNGNDDVVMFLVWSEISKHGLVIPCLEMQPHSLCSHCDSAFGIIPCPSCRCTRFCSRKCQLRAQHSKQCAVLTQVLKEANIQVLEL